MGANEDPLISPQPGAANSIGRIWKSIEAVEIDSGAITTSTEIDLRDHAGGLIFTTSGTGLTTISYHVAFEAGGTYSVLADGAGTAVTSTVTAGEAVPIPDECFAAHFIKLNGDAADTAAIVSLKG